MFLTIAGPGIVQDEDGCPHGFVRLEEREGDKVCRVRPYETHQGVRGERVRVRREAHEQETLA